jgi:5-formyltetrahydrofolate cyclo-ligase
VSPDERRARSRAACDHLLAAPEVASARTLLMYVPLPDELDVWPALHALHDDGRRVVLPRSIRDGHRVECVVVTDLEQGLAAGTFGIPEPVGGDELAASELDVVVSPGRAFDRAGNRIGRGAGYYDRFFKREGFRAFVCGIAYDCQMFPAVPAARHDVPVAGMVTETGFVRLA